VDVSAGAFFLNCSSAARRRHAARPLARGECGRAEADPFLAALCLNGVWVIDLYHPCHFYDASWRRRVFAMNEFLNQALQLYQGGVGSVGYVGQKLYLIAALVAWGDALTSIGAAFMSKMIPLRRMAVLNNFFGWSSGLLNGSFPTLVKHTINLPLNIRRWSQMNQLIDKVKTANDKDLNVDWLKPFMDTRRHKAGEILFSLGDNADEAFVLMSGEIRLAERALTIKPGTLFGEMALFTEHGKRTATAICETDVTLSLISYEGFEQLYFQNPEFGLYLVRLIAKRFQNNLVESEKAAHKREQELRQELEQARAELAALRTAACL
jgi:CRP/FNR family cyclic AMP-dependent transcriptional regulator